MATLDKCDLTIKDLYIQPWAFTTKLHGISMIDIISAYNSRCNIPYDCPCGEGDCGKGYVGGTQATSNLSTAAARVQAKLMTSQGTEVTGDQVTKSIGFLVDKIKALEEQLAKTQKEVQILQSSQ